MKKFNYILLGSVVAAVTNCTKPYNPPVIVAPASYLVVEGVINPGNDTTIIQLSKTVNLSAAANSTPVLGAIVTVSSDAGANYQLAETGNGYYKALLSLNNANKYQLKINTADNKSYASDLVPVKNAPAIDTVTYGVQLGGVQIYASTHDATNSSRYYRWVYTETYVIHTAFDSFYLVENLPPDTIVYRTLAQQIYQCYITDASSNIILGSSAKLAQDVIHNQPIAFVNSNSEKLSDLYSILVKQYALTADAYNYYQLLEGNTTQLGGIFSAQPSQLNGNIHCTSNPAETVIGYITAGANAQKRLFVDSRNLPSWIPITPYGGCVLDTFLFAKITPGAKTAENQVAEYIYNGYNIPVEAVDSGPLFKLIGYSGSSPTCVDCTLRGTNIKPSYWPY